MVNRSKRVAAIHDLSCFGRSSLTVVMPILAKMGIQVCPLPTALLSTHGAYKNGTYRDLTDDMTRIIHHWKELQLEFDVIYSGFLGSGDQIDIVIDFADKFSKNSPLVVVDPVMGDEGKIYSIIDSSITKKMHKLVEIADIITPNTTEAFSLLGREYTPILSINDAKSVLRELANLGPKIVVLTSILSPNNNIRYTGIYDKLNNEFYFDHCEYIPVDYPGTGDAFTSVFIGSILKGNSLKKSLSVSLNFIESALKNTVNIKSDPNDGINIEFAQITL